MLISQNKLSELTGKDRKTVRRLLANLAPASGPHGAKLYDSKLALESLYLGNGDGAFITTAEAFRQLTIARKRQIEIDVEIKRKTRIPIEDVNEAVAQVFGAIRANVKAALPVDRANEVFDEMRRVLDWIQQKANEVTPNGSNGR